MSPADLLDILSKGANPQAVMRHLPSIFANVHGLEFAQGPEGELTRTALGMYSGEGEYVAFSAPCVCEGPVGEPAVVV